MKKIIFSILLSFTLILSCATSLYKNSILPDFIKYKIIINQQMDSLYININFFTIDKDEVICFNFFNSIDSISINIKSNNFVYFDNLMKQDLKTYGIPSEIQGNSIVFPILLKVTTSDKILKDCEVQLNIFSNNNKYIFSKKLTIDKNFEPMSLYPVILNQQNNKIDVGIFAIRNQIIEEFIPSSEELRLEVLNFKGKKIYSSQTGINFLQIILPVYPENIGNYYLYKQEWNFKTNDEENLPSGRYTLNLMIPALPNPYQVNLFMEK